MSAYDHPGREEREADERQEENEVARVHHAALETVEMRHHTEGGDGLDNFLAERGLAQPNDIIQEIGDWWKAHEDQGETNDDRDDETDNLIARHGGGHATHRKIRPAEQ